MSKAQRRKRKRKKNNLDKIPTKNSRYIAKEADRIINGLEAKFSEEMSLLMYTPFIPKDYYYHKQTISNWLKEQLTQYKEENREKICYELIDSFEQINQITNTSNTFKLFVKDVILDNFPATEDPKIINSRKTIEEKIKTNISDILLSDKKAPRLPSNIFQI